MRRLLAATLLLAFAVLPAHAANPEVTQLIERAEFWQSRSRDDLARESLERALRLAPRDPEVLLALGRLQLRADQDRDAAATLERLRQASPGHPGVAQLETLLRVRGPDREKLRQARQLARAGRADEALKAYRALFPDGFPDDELALEHAQLWGRTGGGWEQARTLLAELVRRHPQDARYRVALASHVSTRKPVSAETLRTLRELADAASTSVSRQAREAWRRAVISMDATPESVPLLREYIAANPGETAVKERLDQVLKEIVEGKRPTGDAASRAMREGWAAIEAGRIDEAEARWREALAREPKSGEATAGLGGGRMRQGRHAEGLGLFKRAGELEPAGRAKWEGLARTARYWLLLQQAREARAAGRLHEARARAEEARALDPKDPDAAMELARIHVAAGPDPEAEALMG